jgi:hypothetical protein
VGLRCRSDSSLWGQLGLAANLRVGSQSFEKLSASDCGYSKAKVAQKDVLFLLQSLKTLRFKLIHQPARLLKPQGYSILRFSVAPPVQELIQRMEQKLKPAA